MIFNNHIMDIHCQFDFIVYDIDLDHQVEVVSVSFLHCMCIVFFPHTCVVLFRRKPHSWRWNIYTNLEFSHNNYLVFFSSTYYLFTCSFITIKDTSYLFYILSYKAIIICHAAQTAPGFILGTHWFWVSSFNISASL